MIKKRSKRMKCDVEGKAEQPPISGDNKAVASSHSLINRKFADRGIEAQEMKCNEQFYPSVTYGLKTLPTIDQDPQPQPQLKIDPAIDALCDAEVAELCGLFRNM